MIHRFHVAQQQDDADAADAANPKRLTNHGARFGEPAGTVHLRYRWRHRHDDAGHQQHQRKVQVAAEGDPGEVRGAHSASHDGIGHAHTHLGELGGDDRHGKRTERAELPQHGSV